MMLKKVVVGTILAGLIGVLVFGAVNRTLDKTGRVAEAQGQGNGRGRSSEEVSDQGGFGRGRSSEEVSNQGNFGRGRSSDASDSGAGNRWGASRGSGTAGQSPNYDTPPETSVTYEGTIVQVPDVGVELVIKTTEGEELVIGTGPMDLAAEGFALQVGEAVQVRGYWDANEFKATQLTRLATGQTLILRDEFGQPAWAGSGRSAQGSAQGDQTGTGQAQVEGWIQLLGTVVSVDADALVIQTTSGEQIVVENRPWWFAQEQGFSARAGDEVTLTGFYEGEDSSTGSGQGFEVGRIDDATNGQTVTIRDENGRPMWAARGRRGA
jgi:hypothetical protein